MSRRSHLAAWTLAWIIGVVLWPWRVGPAALLEHVRAERTALHHTFGDRAATILLARATAVHRVFGLAGIDDLRLEQDRSAMPEEITRGTSNDIARGSRHVAASSRMAVTRIDRYLMALQLQWHLTVIRLLSLMAWWVVLAPLAFGALVDGVVQRAVKADTFGYQNPAAFAIASHLFIACAMAPAVAMAAPWAWPALLVPAWLLLALAFARMAVAHLQPVFTR